jgi:predicted transcriptional regulator
MSDARLGPLERRVMDALWAYGRDARVRDLKPSFDEIAYTTLMTTVDRLHRKGLLERVPAGRAFAYRPRFSRGHMRTQAAVGALRHLLDGGDSIEPVLSFLVDEVGERDEKTLDELERLIRERRRTREDER